MGVRLYDPALGRFLEVDPIKGGSCNDYDYVCGDPVNGYDLGGTMRTPEHRFGKAKANATPTSIQIVRAVGVGATIAVVGLALLPEATAMAGAATVAIGVIGTVKTALELTVLAMNAIDAAYTCTTYGARSAACGAAAAGLILQNVVGIGGLVQSAWVGAFEWVGRGLDMLNGIIDGQLRSHAVDGAQAIGRDYGLWL
ncbi:MAG: repeat-containing protein [Actinomycetia bacterium]|nr:repeat-containing protein [Actinomycetes bacterium]